MANNNGGVRPIAEPVVIEDAYTADQHARMLNFVRSQGPWSLILAQHFKTPEEVIATNAGGMPEGFKPTWDMFLSPVFRGYFAKGCVSLHPDLDDCFYNKKFMDLARAYWGAEYACPENMLFNIQGPSGNGGAPHVDGNRFRGISMHNSPVWLMNTMGKSGLFERWRAKKAQVIAWYYRGRIGGGFTYWPDGPQAEPKQIKAPMWGRAVVVENERMYHMAEACGPSALRRPEGLAINSLIGADGGSDGWTITTGGKVIQTIPAQEFRFLIHWGADMYMDYQELKIALDHTDDLSHDQVFETIIKDLHARGESFAIPADPLKDTDFINLLTRVYDPGKPVIYPPEPEEALAA